MSQGEGAKARPAVGSIPASLPYLARAGDFLQVEGTEMKDTIETKIGIIMGMNMKDDDKLQWLTELYLRVFPIKAEGLAVQVAMMGFNSYREIKAHEIRAYGTSAYARRGMKLPYATLEGAVALGEYHFEKRSGNKAPSGFILDTFKVLARDGLHGDTFHEKVGQFPAIGNGPMAVLGYRICKTIMDTNGTIVGLKTRKGKVAKGLPPSPYNKSEQGDVEAPTTPLRGAVESYMPRRIHWRMRAKIFNCE